jgi:RNA polymerase sigma-70 factor (ECF subfamily)
LDLTLLRRYQAGDQDAFALLFDLHKNLVYRTALLTLGDPLDAEDILQEVFVQVHRSLSVFDPARGAFTTWLYRITINKCLNWRRSHHGTQSLEELPEHALSVTPDVEEQQAESESIRQALDRLNVKLRVVIILRHYWDLSYAEIATILDLPLGTVKSRLNLAMRTLQNKWDGKSPSRTLSLPEAEK